MAKLTKRKIIDYLKSMNIYNEIDANLIEELLYSKELAELAKEDIAERGLQIPINSTGTLLGSNPSINIYFSASKQILNISRKLGIEPLIRVTMKLNDDEKEDGF